MNDTPVFNDETCTDLRKAFVAQNTAAVESESPDAERHRLNKLHGKENVWNTDEATDAFDFKSFLAPFVFVTRKSDGAKGCLEFQHSPRFYFRFTPTS